MKSEILKKTVFISGIIIIGLALEFTRKTCDIPITILDIILFPGALLFTILFIRDFFFNKSSDNNTNTNGMSALAGRAAVALLLFIPLGLWSMYSGFKNPFEYFSGVKGAAHGYTLIAIGLFVLILGILLLCSVLRSVLSNK